MSENFEMLLNKGNSLNKLSELSSSLKEDSKKVIYFLFLNHINSLKKMLINWKWLCGLGSMQLILQ